MQTFRQFFVAEADDLWHGIHKEQSFNKCMMFSNYKRFGSKPLDTFTVIEIREFLSFIKVARNLSETTLNRYRASIKAVFRHAMDLELITASPRIKMSKETGGRPRSFSEAELLKIQDFFAKSREPKIKYLVQLSMFTGMRLGELILIGTTAFLTPDKKWLRLVNTKNGDDRDVAMTQKTIELIEKVGVVVQWFRHRIFYDLWKECRYRVAKNDKYFVFHVLRHTYASKLANDLKINTLVIASMMGHRSIITTQKYVHVNATAQQDIAQKMSQ